MEESTNCSVRLLFRITVVQTVSTYWVGVPTNVTVGLPLQKNRPDMTSPNSGSTSPNAGNTPRVPGNTSHTAGGEVPGSSDRNTQQARPGSGNMPAAAEQLPSETNEVVGARVNMPLERTNTLSPERRSWGNRGRGQRGQGAGRRGGLAAWLSGWFGR